MSVGFVWVCLTKKRTLGKNYLLLGQHIKQITHAKNGTCCRGVVHNSKPLLNKQFGFTRAPIPGKKNPGYVPAIELITRETAWKKQRKKSCLLLPLSTFLCTVSFIQDNQLAQQSNIFEKPIWILLVSSILSLLCYDTFWCKTEPMNSVEKLSTITDGSDCVRSFILSWSRTGDWGHVLGVRKPFFKMIATQLFSSCGMHNRRVREMQLYCIRFQSRDVYELLDLPFNCAISWYSSASIKNVKGRKGGKMVLFCGSFILLLTCM